MTPPPPDRSTALEDPNFVLAVRMQQEMGSTRALACPARRLAERDGTAVQSLNGELFNGARVIGEGADHSTRGRVRSPFLPAFFWFVWMLLACASPAFAEQRFPPPEFEGGYKLPATQTPWPRAMTLQYLDVAVLIAALGVACYLVFKKRSRKGVLALSLFSLAYFGFYREGCVCSIGSLQNVALALGDRGYAVPWTVTAFFLAPLVVSLFAGRTFCAAVCPHGALQDLVLLRPVRLPAWLEQGLSLVPFVYLGAAVLFAATGSALIVCRFDPFVPLFRLSGSFPMLMLGASFLLLGMFVGRPYCRFLCPYGALLKLGATVSKWRVTVTPDVCTRCRLCEESCPYGALQQPTDNAAASPALSSDRKRLAGLLVLLPLMAVLIGWAGSRLSVAASRVHPTVALAERFVSRPDKATHAGPQSAPELALRRAEQDPKSLLAQAVNIRGRFEVGGWLFGVWVGLVIGVKLIGLSLRSTRTDFEPDRGSCFACARCFEFCPNERVRRGWPALPIAQACPAVAAPEAVENPHDSKLAR